MLLQKGEIVLLEQYKVEQSNNEEIAKRVQEEKLYLTFVKEQEKGFIRFINYVYDIIDNLKQKAIISPFIEIRARIKDTESAINNYNNNKILDDVFGIEIICANETEIYKIKEELEKVFQSTRQKVHNKANGYKAWHESYSAKDESNEHVEKWGLLEDDVPVVECQFKTIAVELNPEASHHDYKNVNRKEIQKKLENKTLKIGQQIPRMWVSRENGFHELDYKETIQRLYPFVDVTTIKEPEKKINTI